jgi:hypothetical protein
VQLILGNQFSLRSIQNNSKMKIYVLSFIQCVLTGHHPTVLHAHAVPSIFSIGSESFYRISCKALLVVLQVLVKVLRSLDRLTTFDFTLVKINLCCIVRLKVRYD